jgi:hypothetical protein
VWDAVADDEEVKEVSRLARLKEAEEGPIGGAPPVQALASEHGVDFAQTITL